LNNHGKQNIGFANTRLSDLLLHNEEILLQEVLD